VAKQNPITLTLKVMKNKLLIIVLILFAPVLIYKFYYPSTENQKTAVPLPYTDKYLIGVMNAYQPGFNGYIEAYDDAEFNTTHTYLVAERGYYPGNTLRNTPISFTEEHLFDSVPKTKIQTAISNMYNHNGSRFIWQRPKIEWLCSGQSSIYQAEYIAPSQNYWFYSFNNRDVVENHEIDSSQYGPENPIVLFCDQSLHSAGYVVRRLKANTEQSRKLDDPGGNNWEGDSECDWYVKPKIRIPASIPANFPDLEICRIEVNMNNGTTRKTVIDSVIKARHFRPVDAPNSYDGSYLEEFYFDQTENEIPRSPKFTGDLVINPDLPTWSYCARGTLGPTQPDHENSNHADIKIWWYDKCDMWLDYVKVENDIAHNLLNPNPLNPLWVEYNQWIEKEVDAINQAPYVYNFYKELFEFNNIPCMAHVNRRLDELTDGKVNFMADQLTFYQNNLYWSDRGEIDTPQKLKEMFFDVTGFRQIFLGDPYPLIARRPGCWEHGEFVNSQLPITLFPSQDPPASDSVIANILSAPATYDRWLQAQLDTVCTFYKDGPWLHENFLAGVFTYLMKSGNEVSKLLDIPFIAMLQAHQWVSGGEVDREPTVEEQDLMTNLAVSYGAKGIIYWWMSSFGEDAGSNSCDYSRGFLIGENDYYEPRYENLYGQPKWDSLKRIINRLETWGPTLMNFDNTQTNSYIYRLERSNLVSQTYFSDVVSYVRGTGLPPCQLDAPDTTDAPHPPDLRYECFEDRYLQVATFESTSDDRYFMIVNRRCSPVKAGYEDGQRFIRVLFDHGSTDLPAFNNWNIIDIKTGSTISVIKINGVNPYADLGWFAPGEGRLYKMVSTMKSGGTLIADEHISGESFTCEDTVISNGFNITIDEGSVISFTDSATIIMNGGTFTSGVHGTGSSDLVTYKGEGSGKWNGLRFNGTDVKIYNSKFQDIASPCVNYAISMVDCQLADIRTNQFVLNTDTAGAIQSVYIEDPFGSPTYTGLHINYNTITMANSRGYGISVQGFSGITLPLYAGNNTMTSNGYATGILLSTITGGVVKNNSISGFSTGINTLLSTIDVYGNTISNTSSVSKGIISTGLSSSGLLPASGLWLGGMNTITNTSGVSTNIEVNNSVFALEGGNNTFDVTSTSGAYHLYGTFWDSSYNNKQRYNCFKLGGTTITSPANPNYSIGIGFFNVTLNFLDYTCDATSPEDVTVVDLGGGLYDTIPYTGGGEGGSSIGNKQLAINSKSKSKSESVSSKKGVYILSNSALYDSIRIQIRKKNYNAAKQSCYDLIGTYPDSSESISALSYLFLSQTTADTTQTAIGNLKSYYEGLILNHGNNTAMVTMCNYLVQKCKVKLHQYTSALSGFQEIINNNPYSYEGLLAKWDYMATSLLVQGSGGGEREISDFGLEIADSEIIDKLMGWNDRTPLTKEERKTIRQTVIHTRDKVRNDKDAKIKTLEERSKSGDVGSEKELRTLRVLKDINKSVRPANVFEHINIVSGDIQKVFATDVVISNKQENLVPSVFSLSQNYPNPFNPVTTIKYALPSDVKVVVKIYDILGREVKVLVNELQKAGYYDAKFDGSNFASGVYFYRIEAGDFVLAKKMVLVK